MATCIGWFYYYTHKWNCGNIDCIVLCLQVMLDSHGHSKGSGFVAFSTPEEASKAVSH